MTTEMTSVNTVTDDYGECGDTTVPVSRVTLAAYGACGDSGYVESMEGTAIMTVTMTIATSAFPRITMTVCNDKHLSPEIVDKF